MGTVFRYRGELCCKLRILLDAVMRANQCAIGNIQPVDMSRSKQHILKVIRQMEKV